MTTLPQPKSPADDYTATYDAWNRLVKLEDSTSDVQVNEYDGLHRWIVRDETGGSGDKRHFYYNEKWQCIEERQGAETTPHKQYVYHPYYIDAVACMWYDADDDGSIDSTDERYHFLHDAYFDVVAVTDAVFTETEIAILNHLAGDS